MIPQVTYRSKLAAADIAGCNEKHYPSNIEISGALPIQFEKRDLLKWVRVISFVRRYADWAATSSLSPVQTWLSSTKPYATINSTIALESLDNTGQYADNFGHQRWTFEIMRDSLTSLNSTHERHDQQNAIVRIGPLVELPALVRELGHDPDPIFAFAGFESVYFSDADPDVEIDFNSASKLLSHCVTVTGCDYLGLLLGQRAAPSSLGMAGFIAQTSPDVGAALRSLVRHLDLHDQGATLTLLTNKQSTFLDYAIHLPGVKAADQIYDLSMTMACNIMRSLCGPKWNPTEVLLARQPPKNSTRYQKLFRAPIHYKADQNAIVFPSTWLDHEIPNADQYLHQYLEKEADKLHALQQKNLVGPLRILLRKSLLTGQISVKDIAGQLGIHERTLNRRLREEGTNFRIELENIRYEMARQLLTDIKIPISEVATALNYADPTAFSRAFKQWSGSTPREWRRQLSDPLC